MILNQSVKSNVYSMYIVHIHFNGKAGMTREKKMNEKKRNEIEIAEYRKLPIGISGKKKEVLQ